MRRSFFSLPILLALCALAAQAGDDKAQRIVFNSESGGFSVTFPQKPKKQINKTPTDLGQIDVHIFLVDLKDRAFLTSYNDYPNGTVTPDTRKTILDGVIEGNAKGSKGKVLEQKVVTTGKKEKLEGREVLIEMENIKGFYRARVYLKGDRLYQVVALGAGDWAKSDEVTKYLDSFELDE